MTAISIRGRARGRGARRMLSVLVGFTVLTGCSVPTDGLALPARQQAEEYQAARFVESLDGLRRYFVEATNIKGTVFTFASFEGKKAKSEVDTYVLGEPPALLTRSRSGHAGDNIDMYHPAGSDQDLLLLGTLYRSLAPTPWVSHRTHFPKDGFYVCTMTGVMVGCKMLDAMELTQKENPAGLLKKYTRHADGRVELLTGVTLKAFLEARVLVLPDVLKAKVTDEMLKQLIPVNIKFAADGSVDKFEMNGVVKGGPSPFEIQVGYDITGAATKADFPSLPPRSDVTVLDESGKKRFYDRLGDLKSQPI
ncbi:hypothetical protein GCM10027290_60180 [Micromonospora sonneratiae]|uniref:Lipoprotein n=1 Tax=Micromonospora sonneratiae TaxID=1184706 RepID=A0ABW3YQU4_9ACTN